MSISNIQVALTFKKNSFLKSAYNYEYLKFTVLQKSQFFLRLKLRQLCLEINSVVGGNTEVSLVVIFIVLSKIVVVSTIFVVVSETSFVVPDTEVVN